MDASFLKFWQGVMAQVAEGSRRWADLAGWMGSGFSGAPELTELFRTAYRLVPPTTGDPWQTKAWTEAAARFQTSLTQLLEAFDVVSRQRYEQLRREKAELEAKAAAQDQLIGQLRLELAQSRLESGRVVDGFRQLTQLQEAQFRQVSDSIQRFFTPPAAKNPRS
jgi:uncharacterized coiled-coil protein SlyX